MECFEIQSRFKFALRGVVTAGTGSRLFNIAGWMQGSSGAETACRLEDLSGSPALD